MHGCGWISRRQAEHGLASDPRRATRGGRRHRNRRLGSRSGRTRQLAQAHQRGARAGCRTPRGHRSWIAWTTPCRGTLVDVSRRPLRDRFWPVRMAPGIGAAARGGRRELDQHTFNGSLDDVRLDQFYDIRYDRIVTHCGNLLRGRNVRSFQPRARTRRRDCCAYVRRSVRRGPLGVRA